MGAASSRLSFSKDPGEEKTPYSGAPVDADSTPSTPSAPSEPEIHLSEEFLEEYSTDTNLTPNGRRSRINAAHLDSDEDAVFLGAHSKMDAGAYAAEASSYLQDRNDNLIDGKGAKSPGRAGSSSSKMAGVMLKLKERQKMAFEEEYASLSRLLEGIEESEILYGIADHANSTVCADERKRLASCASTYEGTINCGPEVHNFEKCAKTMWSQLKL